MTTADLALVTTGIGSLPHHNVDAALASSFRLSLPFLPQIPLRNHWEFMIAQALEGMPGLQAEADGAVTLDLDVWLGRSKAFNEKLLTAFSSAARLDAFEAFEPASASSSGWQPFLWELEEKGHRAAKIQLAGPLTCQWALRLKDGTPADRYPELGTQIYRLGLARAIAMGRRLKKGGIQPVLYLDEPALYAYMPSNPRHAMAFRELALMIQALGKEGIIVGMHCCSNTDWAAVLGLGLQIVSIDTALSLGPVLSKGEALASFFAGGGRLSLGVLPSARGSHPATDAREHLAKLVETLEAGLPGQPAMVRQILSQSLYTPACGLALHSVAEAELILSTLLELRDLVAKG